MALGGARRRQVMLAGLLVVLALHLLIMALLSRSSPDKVIGVAPARVTLRLIAPQAMPMVATPARVEPAAAAAARRRVAPPSAPAVRDLSQTPSASPAAIAPTITGAAPAQPAAGDAHPSPSLLETEATRRAIRASARAPSLGEQLARAREEPERMGASERLANDVRNAGKGDCLKGDYPGAGMGLLSLPFLAAAAARGQCAQ